MEWAVLYQGNTDSRNLLGAWTVSAELPVICGAGRRLRRLLSNSDSGHEEGMPQSSEMSFEPRETESGQAIGSAKIDPWAVQRARFQERMVLATRLRQALLDDEKLTLVGLDRREGMAPSRVSEIIALMRLGAEIRSDIEAPAVPRPVPAWDDLLVLIRERDARKQAAGYFQIVQGLVSRTRSGRVRQPRQRGFQHLFAQARVWCHWLETGKYRSEAALARAERVNPRRVTYLLDLLALAPEIQAAIDVPSDRIPESMRQSDIFAIAALGDQDEQRAAFLEAWGSGVGYAGAN